VRHRTSFVALSIVSGSYRPSVAEAIGSAIGCTEGENRRTGGSHHAAWPLLNEKLTPKVTFTAALVTLLVCCAVTAWLALVPVERWLRNRALAQPNARSGHIVPTPQGAGIVVIPVALIGAGVGLSLGPVSSSFLLHALGVAGACLLLLCVGLVDDRGSLSIGPRLVTQLAAAVLVAGTLPDDFHLSSLPPIAERTLLVLSIMWFVNLTNFMDGMDWLAASETVAICVGVIGIALLGGIPAWLGLVAAAGCGATIGFMPANAPVARLFLGDAGSLPLGLLICTLLLHLAAAGHVVAALLLPLYFLVDATVTLLLRIVRWEPFWQPHRQHAYQRALARGLTVWRVLGTVALTNVVLVGLAVGTVIQPQPKLAIVAAALGMAAVGLLLTFLAGALPWRRASAQVISRPGQSRESRNSDDVNPAWSDIKQMRVEERTDNVLGDKN
jgi:UDP-N-acetylmuramyl pentapeptide phosphotransferase/UDP-N-acetylglucosamine-1-phosphate transferase